MTNTILVSHTLGITVSAGNTATLEATLWGAGDWANDVDWAGAGAIDVSDINIWEDPLFVCTGGTCLTPYRLAAASAALDEGVPAGVRADIDGEPRFIPDPDLGADEYWRPDGPRWIYLPLVLSNAP